MNATTTGGTTPARIFGFAVLSLLLAATAPAARAETPDALGRRLCDALQTLPLERKARCCAGSMTGSLAGECADRLGRSLRDGTVTLDPAGVDRCVQDATRALEGCDWVTPYLPRVPPSCRNVVRGRLESGGRCRSSLECRDGLHCAGGDAGTPGVCIPPRPPGTVCSGAPDALATYTRQTDDARHPECAGFCLRGRCAAVVAVGGECSSHRECASGTHCAARRCTAGPPAALGESCAGTTCDGDLVCADGRCAPPKKAGEHCWQPFECEASCVGAAPGTPGTCAMRCSAWPPAGYVAPADARLAD